MSVPAEQLDLRQAQSVAIPKRWPLVSKLQARNPNTPLTKDARLINCFAEFDAEDKDYWIYKRPGLSTAPAYSTATTPPNYPLGCGMFTVPSYGIPWIVAQQSGLSHSAALYHLGAASSSAILTMPLNVPTPVWFEVVDSSPQTLVVATGVEAWTVNQNSLVASKIVNANYPATTVPGWAYLDGTLYTMDPLGNIWGSAVNDATTWTALNVIAASSNADLGMALAKQLTYVVAFKQYTTQIFYDAGNAPPGSPLSPVPDAQIPLGCFASNSVAEIDNVLLWMTSNKTVSPQIARMDSLKPRIVSTPPVERILDNVITGGGFLAGIWIPQTQIWSTVLKHGGHRFYILGLSNAANNITLVYDLDQDLWYIWTDANGNWWPIVGLAYGLPISSGGVHYAQHATNGNIYQLDGDYTFPNDYGTLIPVDIYTPNMDFGTVRAKTLSALYFNGDKVSSVLRVRRSDDDYQTWSNFRTVDLSRNKPSLDNEGTFERRRAYHLRHQANTAFRIKTVDMQMDIGTA